MLWKGDFFMKKKGTKVRIFGTLKTMAAASMLTAIAVVIGLICKVTFGDGPFRVTFENLPIIISGIMFGPLVGGVVGIAADLISCIWAGQTPIPLVAVGSVCVGVISGLLSQYVFKKRGYLRLILPPFFAHIVGSMIIKTIALNQFYGMTYGVALLWRIPLYIAIAALEIFIICLMYKNKMIKRLIDGGFHNDIH